MHFSKNTMDRFYSYKSSIYDHKIKNSWIFLLVSKPDVYLFKLIGNTLFVGAITFCLTYLCVNNNIHLVVPATAHQLVGVAIGLLLVFRTQTAYERWSTASKNFNDIQSSMMFLTFKIQSFLNNASKDLRLAHQERLTLIVKSFTDNFMMYLKSTEDDASDTFEMNYLNNIQQLLNFVYELEEETDLGITRSDTNIMHKSIHDIISSCGSCVKIKNTPIPMSYALHIKVSVIIYILSLPFGLFSDLGMWSAVMVMFVYYIVAGIEIISKEIENPFYGDPNDLPIEMYIKNIQSIPANHMK